MPQYVKTWPEAVPRVRLIGRNCLFGLLISGIYQTLGVLEKNWPEGVRVTALSG